MKVGDKYIVEIDKIFEQDGEKLYRAKGMKTLVFDNKGLRKLKPLEEKNMEIIRDKAFEAGQVKGQNDAWELGGRILKMDYDTVIEVFGSDRAFELYLTKGTYAEAAAKVAEWEMAKEEIHVGDIVRIHEGNDNDLCIICSSSDGYYNAVDEYGAVYPTLYKKMISKTGRHIDVDAWLAQIGGGSDETEN